MNSNISIDNVIRLIASDGHNSTPISIVDGMQPPTEVGERHHYENASGDRIAHPNAYRRAWGKPIYCPSTIRIEVGRRYVDILERAEIARDEINMHHGHGGFRNVKCITVRSESLWPTRNGHSLTLAIATERWMRGSLFWVSRNMRTGRSTVHRSREAARAAAKARTKPLRLIGAMIAVGETEE